VTDGRPITDPDVLALAVDQMTWPELERSARAILAGLALVVESAGAQRKTISIARPHPEGAAPTATPMCPCGCPSRRDHWDGKLKAAVERDVAAAGGWDAEAMEPRAFRHTVFQAAEDLRLSRVGPRGRASGEAEEKTRIGAGRSDFICQRYAGMPSARAAHLESQRAGPVDREAIRRTRSRNGFGMEMGEPRPLPADLDEQLMSLHRQGRSDVQIATELDMGDSQVSRLLKGRRSTANGEEEAA
jgi:hypothetical protein